VVIRRPNVVGLGVVALLAGFGLVGCGQATRADGSGSTTVQTLQPVDEALALKAQANCWFKVKNRTGQSEEVRLWNASSSVGAKTERMGELLIVTGGMEPAVRDDRYYACSLFEYTPGSPLVMKATSTSLPATIDSVVPYGFSKDGRKELK
jgi:S-adenosylhomocysteine hydrolase